METIKKVINKIKLMDAKKKACLVALILIVGVMSWAVITAGMITSNFNRVQVQNSADEQKVDAVGVIITETKSGSKYFEIYGETGNYSNDHSIATLHNVIGNFYKEGRVGMSFQSSKGTYNEKTGVITLYENTYIVLEDGTSLNTDKLIWSGSNDETIAEGNVKIRKNDEMIATADKGIIGADYEKFKIVGNTKTTLFESKEK